MYYVKVNFKLITKNYNRKDEIELGILTKIINQSLPNNMVFLFDMNSIRSDNLMSTNNISPNNPVSSEINGYIAIKPDMYTITDNTEISNSIDMNIIRDYFIKRRKSRDTLYHHRNHMYLSKFEIDLDDNKLTVAIPITDIQNNRTEVYLYPKLIFNSATQVTLSEFMKCARNVTKIHIVNNAKYDYSSDMKLECARPYFRTAADSISSNISIQPWYLMTLSSVVELCGESKKPILTMLMDQFAFNPYLNNLICNYHTSNFLLCYNHNFDDNYFINRYHLDKKVLKEVSGPMERAHKPIFNIFKFYASTLKEVKDIVSYVTDSSSLVPSKSVNVISVLDILMAIRTISESPAIADSKEEIFDVLEKYFNKIKSYLQGSMTIIRIPALNEEMMTPGYYIDTKIRDSNSSENYNSTNSLEHNSVGTVTVKKNAYLCNSRRRLYRNLELDPEVFDNSCFMKLFESNNVSILSFVTEYNYEGTDYENISRFINFTRDKTKESLMKLFDSCFNLFLNMLSKYSPIFIWYEDIIPYYNNFLLPDSKHNAIPLCENNPFITRAKIKDLVLTVLTELDEKYYDINAYNIMTFCESKKTINFLFNYIKLNQISYGSLLGSKLLIIRSFNKFKELGSIEAWEKEASKILRELKKSLKNNANSAIGENGVKEKLKESFMNCNTSDNKINNIDSLIGLKTVKDMIKKYTAFIAMNKYKEEHGINTNNNFSKHMCFLGNPGTCKTTVANILAYELYKIGIIRSPYVRVVSRAELVEKYVGWTAKHVNEIIDDMVSNGGILFIDEAYSLIDNMDKSGNNSYGLEAINTLVKRMDENSVRDNLVIIFAGYPEDMHKFLKTNSGLPSRISTVIEFPNYTKDELIQIAKKIAKDMHIKLSDGFVEELEKSINKYINRKDFGNGRFIRSVLEKIYNETIL